MSTLKSEFEMGSFKKKSVYYRVTIHLTKYQYWLKLHTHIMIGFDHYIINGI